MAKGKKKNEYDSLVIFERPLILGNGNRDILYGYLFDYDWLCSHVPSVTTSLDEFAEYVIGLEYFLSIGGRIGKDKKHWKINNIQHYWMGDFVKDFCADAYRRFPVNYTVEVKCNPQYLKKDCDEEFIISEHYKEWKK